MSDLPQHEPQWVDTAISRLLRGGVILSIAVICTGVLLTFIHHPQYIRSKTALGDLTSVDTVYPHHVRDVLRQIRKERGQDVVMLGLLMLIATPVTRVAFSIAAFVVERDRLYTIITIAVLALLVFSFVIGAAG
jgi:uncharacterized membrane protein